MPAASRINPILSSAFFASGSTPPGTREPVAASRPSWPEMYKVLSTRTALLSSNRKGNCQ